MALSNTVSIKLQRDVAVAVRQLQASGLGSFAECERYRHTCASFRSLIGIPIVLVMMNACVSDKVDVE